MTPIDIQTIQGSVQKGTLVELSSDYRTSSAVRACLPAQPKWAMSITAFRRHVLQGTRDEKHSRVEAICALLSNVLLRREPASQPWLEFQFRGKDGRPQSYPLKVEWFAPNQYWVILLPDECIRTVVEPG